MSSLVLRIVRMTALAALAASVAFGARRAEAQATDDATRAAARALGYEGINDYQAGNFAAAADKLDRAYRALRAPSLGLWSARAFDKTGKLVAASERYVEVQRLDASGGDVAVQKQAQADAEADHAALVPRIPNLVIELEGAPAEQVKLVVNGVSVPSSLVGAKRPVDPGTVSVTGEHAGVTASETLTIQESETKTVTLRFAAATPVAPPPPPVVHPTQKPSGQADQGTKSGGGGTKTFGWVAITAGGVGILVGAITGGIAMSTRSSMEGCEGTSCPTSESDSVASYNRLRTISSVGFIAGGVLAATGVVLIVTAPGSAGPKKSAATRLNVSPWLGAGGAGLALGVER